MKKRTLLLTLAALLATTAISANEPTLPFTAAVKENGMWGAVNGAGQVVIPISYDRLGLSLSEADEQKEDLLSEEGRDDLIEAEKGGLRGFFTRTGKEVIPISYESRSIWKEGALAVRGKDKKISFYKKDGSLISRAAYDQVSDFENGMAIVKQGATYGYLSLDGREVKPIYQEARFFEDGLSAVKEKGRWGVIDMTGRYIVSPIYKDTGAAFQEGRLAVKSQKNLWGYIDREGKEIIPPAYKAVSPAFSEGYAAILGDSKLWGFIDTEGNVTAKPQFKAVLTPFSEGLSGVKTIDGNGYARPDGTIAFMADYDQLFPFKDGLAEVREGEVETPAVLLSPSASAGDGATGLPSAITHGAGDGASACPSGILVGMTMSLSHPSRRSAAISTRTEKSSPAPPMTASSPPEEKASFFRKTAAMDGSTAKVTTSLIPSIPVSSPMRKTAYFSPKTKTRNGASSPWKTVTSFCHSPIRRSDP